MDLKSAISTPLSPDMGENRFKDFNNRFDAEIDGKLGAHLLEYRGRTATRFSVWAPNATQISVIGDFNQWNPSTSPLFPIAESGVWTAFVPGDLVGARYQYRIVNQHGIATRKSDPFAIQHAPLPDHASVVRAPLKFQWNDHAWRDQRLSRQWLQEPISIYELHLGSWKRLSGANSEVPLYRAIAEPLSTYLNRLHFTHVLLMPLLEHPFDGSWGYQVTGYYAPTSRYGSPEDFAYLVDYLHQHGIGVLFDWVPAHFPKDDHGLYRFDGTPQFEYPCPKQGEHPDWGTAIFDFAKPQVVSFLISSALHWLQKFHLDGIRVDAVASMIYRNYSRPSGDWSPNVQGGHENLEAVRFLQTLNQVIGERCPGVLRIAEESTAWPGVTRSHDQGGLGFDLKWNLGWMHDTLTYLRKPESERHTVHSQLTLPALYQYTENYCLPFSHDEVVHEKASMLGKMPGNNREIQAHHLKALYAWMWAWPGKKLLFMGSEFGQLNEWDYRGELEWDLASKEPHQGLQQWVQTLNRFYQDHPSLGATDIQPETFHWLITDDSKSNVFAFVRVTSVPPETLLCIGNFSADYHRAYTVPTPVPGPWQLVLSSSAIPEPQVPSLHAGKQFSTRALSLDLPPRTVLYLRPFPAA